MLKKIIAIASLVTYLLVQTTFASDDVTLISTYESDTKTEFYSMYGEQNAADVFYNGEYIIFEDVQPLVLSGVTFVPIRAFCDTIGAEISFKDENFEVVISDEDDVISFIVGSKDINVNGEIMTLSAETFLLSGRTMVPARLISEAFDLTVLWNGEDRQVSIIDENALKINIDTDYTLVNSAFSMLNSQKNEENTLAQGDFTIKTGFGNEETTTALKFTSIASNDGSIVDFNAQCAITMTGLDELALAIENGEIDEITAQILTEWLDVLQGFELNFVYDAQNADIYVWSEDIQTISELFFDEADVEADAVIKISYDDMSNEMTAFVLQNTILSSATSEKIYSVETLIDSIVAKSEYTNLFEKNIYEQALAMSQGLKDENFTKKLSTYTMNLSNIIDGVQVDLQFEIKLDSKDEIESYNFDCAYTSGFDMTFVSISQDSQDEMSMLMNTKWFNEEENLFESLAINYLVDYQETSQVPVELPTENIFEIEN